ncbi:hypothetical protein AFGD_005538 [Aspergillus flavus]|nr:hypothetical protein AFGD_005538 [Aspergillus flavus]
MSDNTSNQQDARLTSSMAPAAWKPDFPDGGLRAWSVAAGAAGLMLCAFENIIWLINYRRGALQLLLGDGALHSNVPPPHPHRTRTRHVATALTLSCGHAKWWLILWSHHLGYGRRSTSGSSQCTGHFCSGHWYYVLLLDTRPLGFIAFSIIYGFTSGAVVSMLSACFAQIPKDPRDIGKYIGIGMFCAAFGALIGTPISGVLVSQSGGFETVSIFSGVMTTVGSCMVLLVELLSGQGLWSRY